MMRPDFQSRREPESVDFSQDRHCIYWSVNEAMRDECAASWIISKSFAAILFSLINLIHFILFEVNSQMRD